MGNPQAANKEAEIRCPKHDGYLGHMNMMHTVRYTELSAERFRNLSVRGNSMRDASRILKAARWARGFAGFNSRLLFLGVVADTDRPP
jgi:hypothetical protein